MSMKKFLKYQHPICQHLHRLDVYSVGHFQDIYTDIYIKEKNISCEKTRDMKDEKRIQNMTLCIFNIYICFILFCSCFVFILFFYSPERQKRS